MSNSVKGERPGGSIWGSIWIALIVFGVFVYFSRSEEVQNEFVREVGPDRAATEAEKHIGYLNRKLETSLVLSAGWRVATCDWSRFEGGYYSLCFPDAPKDLRIEALFGLGVSAGRLISVYPINGAAIEAAHEFGVSQLKLYEGYTIQIRSWQGEPSDTPTVLAAFD